MFWLAVTAPLPAAAEMVGHGGIVNAIAGYVHADVHVTGRDASALEATLRLYLRPDRLTRDLPTLRLLTRPLAEGARQRRPGRIHQQAGRRACHHACTGPCACEEVSAPGSSVPVSGRAAV